MLVEMDIPHGCGDFGISTECKDWHKYAGEFHVATTLLRVNSFPAACACRERLNMGIELLSQGRKADVHKTLISASKVHSKGNVAVVGTSDGERG